MATCAAFMDRVCRDIRFVPLQGSLPIQVSATPSKMGDGLLAAFKRRIIQLHIIVMRII
jgi:hypothetical protein